MRTLAILLIGAAGTIWFFSVVQRAPSTKRETVELLGLAVMTAAAMFLFGT